jgi:hypothetical protein
MRPSRWPVEQLAAARGDLWPQRPAGDFGQGRRDASVADGALERADMPQCAY